MTHSPQQGWLKNTRTVEVCVSFRFDDRFRTERYNFGCSITLRAFFLCLVKEQIIKLLVFPFFDQFFKSNFLDCQKILSQMRYLRSKCPGLLSLLFFVKIQIRNNTSVVTDNLIDPRSGSCATRDDERVQYPVYNLEP